MACISTQLGKLFWEDKWFKLWYSNSPINQGNQSMPKITFIGAGSTVFVKNVIGDSLLSPALQNSEIALYDIDARRLRESKQMLEILNTNINQGRAKISAYLGVGNRQAALQGANYVVNAIQVGGYKPATVIDFEIPKKFGLRQTIADTLGIGGIFRALRTIPVMVDFAHEMERVCPNAWLLNYTNPMSMLTGAMLRGTRIRTVGLCHSVQVCADGLLRNLGMAEKVATLRWNIAGINHMGWLLAIADGDVDLYPEIRKRAARVVAEARRKGAPKNWDMVRLDLIRHFGYYITESSEHNAEYTPYWIKSRFPGLVEEFGIPLDEYPRRCISQIADWKKRSVELTRSPRISHTRSHEYGSYIMEAIETNVPYRIGGNVLNQGLITNLPAKAVVEVPCLVDRNGVQGCFVGELPEQCAALNRTNINVQLMTIEAALTGNKDALYQAAYLDPHTAAELPLDRIRNLCDALIKAHGKMLPPFKSRVDNQPNHWKPNVTVSEFVSDWQISPLQPKLSSTVAAAEFLKPDYKTWQRVKQTQDSGFINAHDLTGGKDGIVYLAKKFKVATAGKWEIRLGHDGGARLFVDGTPVLAVPEAQNPAVPGRSKVLVTLAKGAHEVVVALDLNGGNGWGIFFAWGKVLKGKVKFPTAA